MFRKLVLSCAVVLAASPLVVLAARSVRAVLDGTTAVELRAPSPNDGAPSGLAPRAVTRVAAGHAEPLGLVGTPLGSAGEKALLGGNECPAGYLCGQNPDQSGLIWVYSDLGFAFAGGTGLIASESFPPPGTPT